MRGTQSLDGMLEIAAQEFESLEDIPLDYALMERSANIAVVPTDFGWSDIGSWNAVSHLVAPDDNNNRAIGEAIFVDSTDVFVQNEDRLVAALGVENLMIVDTPDALLMAHSAQTQNVKKIVAMLKKSGQSL